MKNRFTLIILITIFFINLSYSQSNIWIRTNELQNEYISGLVINLSGHIFAGSFPPSKIFRSTDKGISWTHLIDLPNLWSLAINDSQHVFAATLGGEGIYRSKDNGNSWHAAGNGLVHKTANNLAFSDIGYVFAATDDGMYRSSDNGDNWAAIDSGLPATLMYDVCVAPNGHVFVGTYDMGIYRSIDNGLTWEEKNIGLINPFIWSLLFTENGILFSGPDAGYVERSLNEGQTWTLLSNGLPNTWFFHVLETNSEGSIFVGFESEHGVYRSDDNGTSWSAYNSGLPAGIQVASICVNQQDELFIGTIDGVYKTINPSTSVTKSINYPKKLELKQNYPNPFNQSTIIKFYIPLKEFVELKIFDVTGKLIETVISAKMNSGIHEYKWITSEIIASGVYFYSINVGGYTSIKKMLYLK